MNSERKNYPSKECQAIFPISSISVIRSSYAKEGQFSILALFQNVWDLYKFGLQIWIQNSKITLWTNFKQFFQFHRFWSSGPRMRNKVISQYQLYFKIYGIFINLGCRFVFRTQNLPYERFSRFFPISSILVIRYAKQGHFSILALFRNVWDLHKFGLQIWIQNAKITLQKNVKQFFQFHRFRSSSTLCETMSFLNISCI